MLPLLELEHSTEESQALLRSALEEFPVIYAKEWQHIFRSKLGLQLEQDGDIELIERLLQTMHDSKVDFTVFFRQLSNIQKDSKPRDIIQRDEFIDRENIDQWFADYIDRLQSEIDSDEARKDLMDKVNPKYILRNHLAQVAIEKAQQDDFSEIERLQLILNKPFDEQEAFETYAKPPPIDMQHIEVSCSS
jgi:uncharacterized protein YdiU (UPF0061 family)